VTAVVGEVVVGGGGVVAAVVASPSMVNASGLRVIGPGLVVIVVLCMLAQQGLVWTSKLKAVWLQKSGKVKLGKM